MITRQPVNRAEFTAAPWRVRWLDRTTIVVGTGFGPDHERPQAQVLVWDLEGQAPKWTPEPGPWQVRALAVSANDALVAVAEFADFGATLIARTRVLDTATGQVKWAEPQQTYYSKRWFGRQVAFTPDSRVLWAVGPVVTPAGEPIGQVWRVDLGSQRREVVIEDDHDVRSLAVSPDGRLVAVAGGDALIVMDDDGREVLTRKHDHGFSGLAFSPDSKLLAAGCLDGTVCLVDPGAQSVRSIAVPRDQPVQNVAFSPDGTAVAAVVEQGVGVYEVREGGRERFPLVPIPEASTAVFSPDLRYLAVNQTLNDESTPGVIVVDAHTGAPLWQHTTDDRVSDLAFSADGGQLLAGGAHDTGRGFAYVYETGSIRARQPLKGAVTSLVTSTNAAETLVGAADTDRLALVFDVDQPAVLRLRRPHDVLVTALAISPDNQDVVTGCANGKVRLFHGSTVPVWEVSQSGPVTELACSPAGGWVAVGGADRMVRLRGRADGAQRWESDHRGLVTALAFSPDGTLIGTGSADRRTRILDAATGAELHGLTQDDKVVAVAFAPNGTALATGNQDGTAFVLDPATGEVRQRLGHTASISALAISPDSRVLATGSDDGTVQLTSLTGAGPSTVDFEALVTALAFSPRGRLAVVTEGATAALVTVLDPATRTPLVRLSHPGRVRAIAFTADGRFLVTGCDDKLVRVFEAVW
ncbi:WD40 repeat domain-containing protein [Umezawaea sp. NPDC059074]|uniref:WD40 repeat domain-containing protein n=1 Tax=Umezawaea sp. NPDC059074 TaxID=3346716 RepID=UPI003694A4D1